MLHDKFRREPAELADIGQLIRGFAEIVRPTRRLAVVTDDPDDDRILECAVASGSRLLVSGDKHSLRLEAFENIHIVSVSAFLDQYFPALSDEQPSPESCAEGPDPGRRP